MARWAVRVRGGDDFQGRWPWLDELLTLWAERLNNAFEIFDTFLIPILTRRNTNSSHEYRSWEIRVSSCERAFAK